ncbi:MAG: PspC domain-containing protein [Chlamydiales bacterium]
MRLYRCRWDKKIGGVLGGVGNCFAIDPTLLRIIAAIVCVCTLFIPFIIVYGLLWLFLPQGPSAYIYNPAKRLTRSMNNRKIAGVCGGIGEYFHIDPLFIRIGFIGVALVIKIFPMFIIYSILASFIPESFPR